MARFTCPSCPNSFEAAASMAVCNGINVKADANGAPVDHYDNLLPPGAELTLVGMNSEAVPVAPDGSLAPSRGIHYHAATVCLRED